MTKKISLGSGLVLVIVLAVWWSVAAQAAAGKHDHKAHSGRHTMQMSHITTQAEAEALKPGDSMAMVCSMCKHVTVYHVTKEQSHVKLMTIGQKHKCASCGGRVTVVGAGKGKRKKEKVNFVCTKCGDDAMFVCATKPGSSSKHHHKHGKK